jgi:flagellar motility protein MotE (MotC chaperone)
MPANSVRTKNENLNSQGSENKGKGTLSTFLTIAVVVLILAAVFGGVFYFIIHNNVNGLADRYRGSIQNMPVARLALPKTPDLLDSKNISREEVIKKYTELKTENDALKKQLAESSKKLDEYQVYKDDFDNMKSESEKELIDIKDRSAALDEKELKLNELKKKLDELTANGDKEAFKAYYEQLDPENAKQLYSAVIKEQQTNENVKKFAQVYAAMDASAAARIFEQLGTSKIDMTAETLKAMSKENSSAILQSMTPVFAAKVTEKLNALYRGN